MPADAMTPEELNSALAPGARLMGLDLGTKTIGVAISDVNRSVGTALETIKRTKFRDDAARMAEIIADYDVGGIVIGLPLNMDGSEGPRAQSARAYARNLARPPACRSCYGTSGCPPWRRNARLSPPTHRASAAPR